MKTIKLCIGVLCASILMLMSCQKEQDEILEQSVDVETIIPDKIDDRQPITDKTLLKFIKDLDIDVGSITKGSHVLPDGSVEERVYVGDDIGFTYEELELLQQANISKQYRSQNLVTGSHRTINILGYTASTYGLRYKAQVALYNAVIHFNSLNTSLYFNLTWGTDYNASDIVVYDSSITTNEKGGLAGFPTFDGRPYKWVQIFNINNFSTTLIQDYLVHEIGHTIGFRHTDWFDRLSCRPSNQGNEGVGQEGAIHIPGTPTGRDHRSVMLACGSANPTGKLTYYDKIALQYMYPNTTGGICDGVPEWQNINYPIGSRVTYQGHLYEKSYNNWTYLGQC